MSLNESIVEDAALAMPAAALTRPLPRGEERELGSKRVKIEIGRVKSRSPIPISLFTLHSSLFFCPAAEPGHSRGGVRGCIIVNSSTTMRSVMKKTTPSMLMTMITVGFARRVSNAGWTLSSTK